MKQAKSYKILILFLTAMALMITSAFMMLAPVKASAASRAEASSYFTGTYSTIKFEDSKVVASVADGETVKIKNQLVIEDFGLELVADFSKIETLTISFTSKSYGANGNLNADGKYDTSIVNAIEIGAGSVQNTLAVKLNDNSFSANVDGNLNVNVTVDNAGALTAKVEDGTATESDDYYFIGKTDKYVAYIEMTAELKDGVSSADLAIVAVDQKASDTSANFRQTFELNDDGAIKKHAYPRVAITDSLFQKGNDYITVITGNQYELRTTAMSVTGGVSSSQVYLFVTDDAMAGTNGGNIVVKSTKPKAIMFNKSETVATDDMSFNVCFGDRVGASTKVCETYNVKVVDVTPANNTAPTYDMTNTEAYKAFLTALNDAVTEDYGADGVHSIRLGTSVNIPSFEDLVSDDYTSYANLTHTIYYKTPTNASSNTSLMKFTVNDAGNYEFYVVFRDKNDGAMVKDDFYKVEDQELVPGAYYNSTAQVEGAVTANGFVFRFRIEDDAPLSVEAPGTQANGFSGVRYTASDFDVKASGLKTTYKLYYNASTSATVDESDINWRDNWVEIPTSSKATSSNVPNGFKLDEVKSIAYDGKVTFTPVKLGTYVLECSVTSNTVKDRSDWAISTIHVLEEADEVKPANYWLRDHAWSVVFLSVGTICLIGVVVLLFSKPKKVTEDEE